MVYGERETLRWASSCFRSQRWARSQAVARIADRTASQHLRGHVTSSVTRPFHNPYAISCWWSFGTEFRPLSRRRQPPRRIIRHAPRRRRIFLWLSRIPAEFLKRSSQPNIFRRKFGANIQRSLNETDCIKSSHFS